MSQKTKAAVIGTGAMGRHHVRVLREMEDVDLVGVFDADRRRARVIAAEHGTRHFASLDQLLEAGPEAVSIAVPTSLHADYAIRVMRSGVHVLVEKPIAGSLRDASAMIQTARSTGRHLMVGHIERFNPAVRALQEAVAPEDILAVNIVRVGPRPPRIKDAGVIVDLAVHDIDLAVHLTGRRVADVFCVTSGHPQEHEDTASILLRLDGGVSVQLTANWITPYKSREIQLITENRVVRADLISQTVRAFSRDGTNGVSIEELPVQAYEPLRAELDAFISSVQTGSEVPVTARDGLRALEVAVQATALKHIRLQRAA